MTPSRPAASSIRRRIPERGNDTARSARPRVPAAAVAASTAARCCSMDAVVALSSAELATQLRVYSCRLVTARACCVCRHVNVVDALLPRSIQRERAATRVHMIRDGHKRLDSPILHNRTQRERHKKISPSSQAPLAPCLRSSCFSPLNPPTHTAFNMESRISDSEKRFILEVGDRCIALLRN